MGELIFLLMAPLFCWLVAWYVIKWIGKRMGFRVKAKPEPSWGQPPLLSPEQVPQLTLAVKLISLILVLEASIIAISSYFSGG